MSSTELLSKVLSPRTLDWTLQGAPRGDRIHLVIPDLRGCDFESAGDWGPMYWVRLNYDYPIRIFHSSEENSDKGIKTFTVRPQWLYVSSPMLAQERDRFPLYMEIPWDDMDSDIVVFFTPEGREGSIVVQPRIIPAESRQANHE